MNQKFTMILVLLAATAVLLTPIGKAAELHQDQNVNSKVSPRQQTCFEKLTLEELKDIHLIVTQFEGLRQVEAAGSGSSEIQTKIIALSRSLAKRNLAEKTALLASLDPLLSKTLITPDDLVHVCAAAEKAATSANESKFEELFVKAFNHSESYSQFIGRLIDLNHPLRPVATLEHVPYFSHLAVLHQLSEIPGKSTATEEEKKALLDYRVSTFRPINDHLRNNTPNPTQETLAGIRNLDGLMSHSQIVPHSVQLFRGMHFNVPKAWKEKGTHYTDKGFGSTSLNPAVATYFAGNNPDRDSIFDIIEVPENGYRAAVAPPYNNNYESEILLPRGTKYEVVEVKLVDGKNLPTSQGPTTKKVWVRWLRIVE